MRYLSSANIWGYCEEVHQGFAQELHQRLASLTAGWVYQMGEV